MAFDQKSECGTVIYDGSRHRDFSITRMIEGIGFYFDSAKGEPPIPTFDELHEMVEKLAYEKSRQAGFPKGHDWEFWLQAEHELFCGLDGDGYDLYICDLSKMENKGFFRHFNQLHVAPGYNRPM